MYLIHSNPTGRDGLKIKSPGRSAQPLPLAALPQYREALRVPPPTVFVASMGLKLGMLVVSLSFFSLHTWPSLPHTHQDGCGPGSGLACSPQKQEAAAGYHSGTSVFFWSLVGQTSRFARRTRSSRLCGQLILRQETGQWTASTAPASQRLQIYT